MPHSVATASESQLLLLFKSVVYSVRYSASSSRAVEEHIG